MSVGLTYPYFSESFGSKRGVVPTLAANDNSYLHLVVNNISYHASGAIASMLYGNGQAFSQSLTLRLQPLRMLSHKSGVGTALDLTYGYDVRGKVNSIANGAITGDDRTYNYDDLGRLKTATGSWGSSSYQYDALGNILRKQVGARTIEMSYNATNRLTSHVDLDASDDPIPGTERLLQYDMHGNVKTLGAQRFKYDMADQPRQLLTDVTGDYVYDGNLKRVKSVIAKDGATKTIYNVYDASGTLVHVDEHTDGKYTDYIGKIARVTNGGWATWLHMDHLGSAQTGTDMFGLVSWREQYTPYGETLTNPLSNNDQAGFTGHIKDSATGLNYMQARYYDPLIGRFLSIDPVTFMDSGHPGSFNRYAYTFNDPINHNDPDGEFAFLVTAAIGAAAGAAIETGFQLYRNGGDFKSLDGGAIRNAAIVGGVVGATGGLAGAAVKGGTTLAKGSHGAATALRTTGGRIGNGVVVGAVGNASGEAATQVINNESLDGGAIAKAGAIGAVAGAVGGVVGGKVDSALQSKGFQNPTVSDLTVSHGMLAGGTGNPQVANQGANLVQAGVAAVSKSAGNRFEEKID